MRIQPEGPRRQMQDFERWVRGELFVEEVPLSPYVFKRCICWGPSGLSKPENSEAFFRKTFSPGAEATHTPVLNTSSITALRWFRPIYSITGSPVITDLQCIAAFDVSRFLG